MTERELVGPHQETGPNLINPRTTDVPKENSGFVFRKMEAAILNPDRFQLTLANCVSSYFILKS